MLFSKLLRLSSGSLAAKAQGNPPLNLSIINKAIFSLSPSLSSSDKPYSDSQHVYQPGSKEHFGGNSSKTLKINGSLSNWTSSPESMIIYQTRASNVISGSFISLTTRPAVSLYCTFRSLSSQGKGESNKGKGDESDGTEGSSSCKPPIKEVTIKDGFQTRDSVTDFLTHLTEDQKKVLYHSLNIEVLRDKYEGHLGSSASESHQFLSKFGRPAAALGGKEDPTGTLCEVSPKWLHARIGKSTVQNVIFYLS